MLVFYTLLALAIILIILGIYFQRNRNIQYKNNFNNRYVYTQGLVIDLLRYRSNHHHYTKVTPIVRFDTQDGTQIIYQSKIRMGNLDVKVGDSIGVYYDPQNPDNVKLHIKALQYVPIILCSAFSFVILVFAAIAALSAMI